MDEDCKTCAIYERGYCTLILSRYDSKCPCKECLIKSMCENPCVEFNDLVMGRPQNIKRSVKFAKKKGVNK